ncbi:MAG: hypothetical protein P4L84_27480 [Isosphaeraceae bacterium]|nr:hypothetical protein [Isosphaeraceae bacterium]
MGKSLTFFAATCSAVTRLGRLSPFTADDVKVVDLWGGFRNGITKAPWQEDTLVNMF